VKSRRRSDSGEDLFSVDPSGYLPLTLSSMLWPDGDEFPVNHSASTVRSRVWVDLVSSSDPLVVAGFSSIGELIELIASWSYRHDEGTLRLVLGSEPFATTRSNFASARIAFTNEVQRYWLEDEGVSLRSSAKLLRAVELIEAGRVNCRFVDGHDVRLHAKIYCGAQAATLGSSNFTRAGLSTQVEANARFTVAAEPDRYQSVTRIALNYFDVGSDWNAELVDLLRSLLAFVSWGEALAKACVDLLEGEWAARYLAGDAAGRRLWPSQRLGIAQALWIAESVGSVLVADATGSGKTRMGAHLVRAVRDRLWSTGRVRRDLTVLVCPPAVEDTWYREAVSCGLTMNTVSHGLLSRSSGDVPRVEQEAVRDAQILAVDESHNFLGRGTNRTRQVRDSRADHVLLFTATPINRGASDLLQLVGLLGADNFEDETLSILDRLERRRGSSALLSSDEQALLRREIQRFTVRRTKAVLNELVDRDPDAYRTDAGRVCRYPHHEPHTYTTGETDADDHNAAAIRAVVSELDGVSQLETTIEVPAGLRHEYSDQRWLEFRLGSCHGLAGHHVLGAMRSSRAALVEHLAGTDAASERFSIAPGFKAQSTGNVIGRLNQRALDGPPAVKLDCDVPEWLIDPDQWRERCDSERVRYQLILEHAHQLSAAREQRKAEVLIELSTRHDRVLAFDHHLITLAQLEPLIVRSGTDVVVATGADVKSRKRVEKLFALTSTATAIALCSDAMNEGLNLQGASAIVHLDLPTTLRVAEQRVGRVDRMDSPHDRIEAWWPRDGPAFATRANELLTERAAESRALLGSNLPIPHLGSDDPVVDVDAHIGQSLTVEAETWDGIRDALDPIRSLVAGPNALIAPATYNTYRTTTHRVVSRVSPVSSDTPWVFFAVAGTAHGAPRWLLLEHSRPQPVYDLDRIAERLRHHLADDPAPHPFDDVADEWLAVFLNNAARLEHQLLPRRLRRSLEQMTHLTNHWASKTASVSESQRWRNLATLTSTRADHTQPDQYIVAQRWYELVTPVLEQARNARRRRTGYVQLRDVTGQLEAAPLELSVVEEAMSGLERAAPFDQRVTACILGVPSAPQRLPSP
jgi:hypothetical protein